MKGFIALHSILNELVLLAKKGSYVAYFFLGRSLPVKEQRRIYKDINTDFIIKWDLYYLNLTLAVVEYPKIAKVFLLILCNLSLLKLIVQNRNWVYDSNYSVSDNICEVYFRDNGRNDLKPFLGNSECSIIRKTRNDLLNTIRHLRVHFTFKKLFTSRIEYFARKFKYISLPKTIILYEGMSVEYRSLYAYAKDIGINVEFSWNFSNSILYEPEELAKDSNLDYPGRLHREVFVPNQIVELSTKLIFDETVLIIVPTFHSQDEIIDWVDKTIQLLDVPEYRFSVHPTYDQLKLSLINKGYGNIDESKSDYMRNYSIFVGCYSTLMVQAKKKGKTVIPIGYSQDQVERIDSTLSDTEIYYATT